MQEGFWPRMNTTACSRARIWCFALTAADCYRARSSGILAEAIVAGKPTVVREGTWLARQQPSGSGERFTDLSSLVEAVRLVCERYPAYAAGAARVRERSAAKPFSGAVDRPTPRVIDADPRPSSVSFDRKESPSDARFFFYPWGNFYPATAGCDFVACNQLDYLQSRNHEVHCLLLKVFSHGEGDLARLMKRFPCIKSTHVIEATPAGLTLRDLLFGFERAARSAVFRDLAKQHFDLFFANYVLSAPFACELPPEVFKVVETIDLLSGSYRTTNLLSHPSPPPLPIQRAEEEFVLKNLEVDLYQAFDRALMISEKENEAVRAAGYSRSEFISQPFRLAKPAIRNQGPFRYDLVFVGSENHLNTHGIRWFYRHIFLPYLRRHQVRLAVAGRVCENLDFEDSFVTKLGFTDELDALYNASKLVVVPIFEGTGMAIKIRDALAAGRAVVSTPVGCRGIDPSTEALVCVDMMEQPAKQLRSSCAC